MNTVKMNSLKTIALSLLIVAGVAGQSYAAGTHASSERPCATHAQ